MPDVIPLRRPFWRPKTPQGRFPTAREAFDASQAAILAGGKSADMIQLRRYFYYVFRDDWLHANIGKPNRNIGRGEMLRRIDAGDAAAPGEYGGDFDASDQKLFQRFCDRFGRVNLVDIGANYGHEGIRYALLARAINTPVFNHILVEPAHAGLLAPANLLLHGLGDAIIVRRALGEADTVDLFYFTANCTTGGTLLPNTEVRDRGGYQRAPVRTIRWDSLYRSINLNGPTFFKVDIQGAEPEFLVTAADYLLAHPCAGICEFTPKDFSSNARATPSYYNPVQFLHTLMKDFFVRDAGIGRDRSEIIPDPERFVEDVRGRERYWTDLLFWPKQLGPDFLT